VQIHVESYFPVGLGELDGAVNNVPDQRSWPPLSRFRP
jgi:hypothetical protein